MKKATHFGTINIGGKDLSCAVLEDGTRILTQKALFQVFERSRFGRKSREQKDSNLPIFMLADNLKPYIDGVLSQGATEDTFEQNYIGKGRRELVGFKAEILPHICDAFLKARDAGILSETQKPLATVSDILVRSLSKVGIVALIDEATGYQYDRDSDALNKLLRLYISEELIPWQKRFPDVYYEELCRLNGWPKEYIFKRPSVVGTWTNKLIYEQLPPDVLEELKRKTPKTKAGNRKHRFFQWLTEDIGDVNLGNQLTQIITLFRLSKNMKHVWNQFELLLDKQKGVEQLEIEVPYPFDESGYTIAPVEEINLSEFDKNVKKMIDNN